MNLFCEKTNSSTSIDFEQQISNVLDLFGDGTITSYAWRVGPSETSWQKGEKVWEDYSIFIEKIRISNENNTIKNCFLVY